MTGQAPVRHTGARAACHQGRNYGLAAFSSLPAGALPGGAFRLHSLSKRAFRLCRAGERHGPTARPCALNSKPLSSALDTSHSKTGNPFGLPVFSRRALWQYPRRFARRALKGFLAACGPFHRFLPVCLTLTGPLMGRTRPKRFGAHGAISFSAALIGFHQSERSFQWEVKHTNCHFVPFDVKLRKRIGSNYIAERAVPYEEIRCRGKNK